MESLSTAFTFGTIITDSVQIGYRLYDSKSEKRRPLIIFLHGAGERGNDNEKQLTWGVQQLLNHSIQLGEDPLIFAPQCPEKYRWVEVEWSDSSHVQPIEPSVPLKIIMDYVDDLIQNLGIDKSRVYIAGLSMGGFGVWDWITRDPDLFAAAIPICGGADDLKLNKVAALPLWIFHGENDKVVLPERSRNAYRILVENNSTVTYTEFENVAHNSWTKAFDLNELYQWLFSQKK